MKLLFVSQYLWTEGFRINDLVKTLTEKGVEVNVLTGKPNYPEGRIYLGYSAIYSQREQWGLANLYRIFLVPRGAKSALRLVMNYFSFMVSGLLFCPWLSRKRRYDAIFVYGVSPILQVIPALLLTWLKRIPLIIWVQDLWLENSAATGYVATSRCLDW